MSQPPFASNEAVLNALNWRYATKQFDPARRIPETDWKTLEEALILSPSAFGLQPWKFLVITDQATKEKLVPVSWNQRQVADCSHLVIFAHPKTLDLDFVDRFLKRTAEVRGVPVESLAGYREVITKSLLEGPEQDTLSSWSRRQTFIALGNFLTTAALLGIDACPMEGIAPSEYDRILGLDQRGLVTCAACPVGYRAETDKYATLAKVRFEPKDVIEYI
jgi:nitroreductase